MHGFQAQNTVFKMFATSVRFCLDFIYTIEFTFGNLSYVRETVVQPSEYTLQIQKCLYFKHLRHLQKQIAQKQTVIIFNSAKTHYMEPRVSCMIWSSNRQKLNLNFNHFVNDI